ncbi:MAG: zincin-like metallopeptidase domain-containing protein [Gemmataceae bacterium]
MSTQTDIRQQVTTRIVDALRAGTPPWRRPWRNDVTNVGFAANGATGHTYRGVNALLLSLAGYECRWWATYAQIRALGGRVRTGEHSTRIVFYRRVERAVGATADGDEVLDTFPLLRTYSVFNIEQTDGLERLLPRPCEPRAFVPFAQAEAVLAASGADIRYGGRKAEYDPERDFIRLPDRGAFAAPHDFYGTAFHELAHWTGHTSRLDRLSKNARFGSTAYAREELVAEIGGCFLSAEIGIPQSDGDLTNHAAYLNSWLKILGNDPTAIFIAASQASAAAGFLFSHAPQPNGPTAALVGTTA